MVLCSGELTPKLSTINLTEPTEAVLLVPKEANPTISVGSWSPAELIVLLDNSNLGNSGWISGSWPKYTRYFLPTTGVEDKSEYTTLEWYQLAASPLPLAGVYTPIIGLSEASSKVITA